MYWAVVLAAMVTPPPEAAALVEAARADAAKRFGVEARLAGIERVTWRDASLGCPRKDMQYTQALVPGWRMKLVAGGRTFDYHASARGQRVTYCPPGRATDALPDART